MPLRSSPAINRLRSRLNKIQLDQFIKQTENQRELLDAEFEAIYYKLT